MNKRLTGAILLIGVMISCNDKKEENKKSYISIVSLIRKQVAHVDTALYSIVKTVSTDSLHTDTTYVPREEFAKAAVDFLEIPDLSDPKIAKRFKEEEPRYEELLNRVIISYTPVYAEKEEYKKQELLVTPDPAAGDKVTNIIVNKITRTKDGFLEKKMLWQMDKSFQVITISQLPGKPETTTTTRVSWNEGTN